MIDPEHNGPEQTAGRRGAPLFETRIKRTESLTCIELFGELDLSCADRFADAVDPFQGGRLVLDLHGLTFIDSMGLRMILGIWQRSRDEGFAFEIVGARDQVERVFRITGVESALPMTDQTSPNGFSSA